MSPAAETLRRARRAGVRVGRNGDKLALGSLTRPSPELLRDLGDHKAVIVGLLRNPVCQQCGESDGLQTLVDGVWLHQECAAYRRRCGIPWSATLDELAQMTVAEVTAVTANARLEIPKPRTKQRAA